MALLSRTSTLNPNAPLFVPAAFRRVEDFSPEWWRLVTTSTWYHDYWLSQQRVDGFYDSAEVDFGGNDVVNLLPDTIDLGDTEEIANMESQFEEFIKYSELDSMATVANIAKNDVEQPMMNLSLLKSLEETGARSAPARYAEKPAKPVTPKSSTRRIQQPR